MSCQLREAHKKQQFKMPALPGWKERGAFLSPALGGVPAERRGGFLRDDMPGTHPGPCGPLSLRGGDGFFLSPSWEGCRASGGVGFRVATLPGTHPGLRPPLRGGDGMPALPGGKKRGWGEMSLGVMALIFPPVWLVHVRRCIMERKKSSGTSVRLPVSQGVSIYAVSSSTKERAEAKKAARKLYVKDEAVTERDSPTDRGNHENTQIVVQTRRLGRPAGERSKDRTRPVREDLRSSLLDKAEAQIKAGKLPHTEIGLMYKLEKLIAQREKKGRIWSIHNSS